MPSIFSRLKGKDGSTKTRSKKNGANDLANKLPTKPLWDDAYTRKTVEPEEIRELVKVCTAELKARGLDIPFLLLPFRPTSDPSAVRTFVRHFFDTSAGVSGDVLLQELRMTEPMVISGVIKWCWSRLQGGVVGWDAYELFKIGEQDSNEAPDSFNTFIPLSVDNAARAGIIFDLFDLLSAIAAHGKANGFGGRKLSRMASWWAFDSKGTGNGFEGGYKDWLKAADATSHLFFAYLRSLSPARGPGSFATLPMSLQKLLQETEYPPQRPVLLQTSTFRVIMIVDNVSPTPFSLLRRGSHFEYRDEDRALREFSDYEDPVQALTDECRRVLKAISAANQTQAVSSSKHSTSLRDASWSRFEDVGFGSLIEEDEDDEEKNNLAAKRNHALRTTPASGGNGLGRPTTPSWADFLSSGFVDDGPNSPSNILLPPDKILPPIDTNTRQRSSQSHRPRLETERALEPGELASISRFDLDDAFWWVWMSSLAPEETPERKSAFGRCAVIETSIKAGRWLVMEEVVKGAAAEPDEGAYIAEKKGFFSWTRRNKGISRSKSVGKQSHDKRNGQGQLMPGGDAASASRTSIAANQQAKIQAAAQKLQARHQQEERERNGSDVALSRRGRTESHAAEKTTSVFTLQPVIASEASPALKWASKYDKEAIREKYLGNINAGRGQLSVSSPNVHLSGLPSPTGSYNSTATEDAIEKPATQIPRLSPLATSSTTPALSPKPAVSTVQSPTLLSPASVKDRIANLTEKSKAAPAPAPISPRIAVSEPSSMLGPASPRVPPKDTPEDTPTKLEPVPVPASNPEGKKAVNKLHKDGKEKEADEKNKDLPTSATANGGFRKLFNRKNRQSKLPENAGADVSAMLAAAAAESSSSNPSPKPTAPAEEVAPTRPIAAPIAAAVNLAPAAAAPPASPARKPVPVRATPSAIPVYKEPVVGLSEPAPVAEPADVTSGNSVPGVDTAEEMEVKTDFNRFDQCPLDQPAFVPEDSDTEEEAVPPPIARQRSPVSPKLVSPAPVPEPAEPSLPPALDRWAQIRKNAADRAAQRQTEVPPSTTYTKPKGAGEAASGEETIESRVARIKARVAELTGNMEGVNGPGSRPAPLPIRR
ncbi:morphogenesis protein [Grosmannia clavigera kw1407]|uniref:Morphogenesis protein n=1 Tax=Grosmannia clavigera (strain kw1407 / UAMH 11150) TaxID=655863 RepID=F0XN41_GROCL|nr:morphogenesis protein [Grosmannia clavigera kw1407]EFX00818.1 morphogenesis protein [Grosmannia clavigera kw1407]